MIEGDARRDPHAFDPLLGPPVGCHPMNRAVVAAGDKKTSRAVQRQSRRINQRRDKRLDTVVRRDFVQRNRNALAPRPAKRYIDVPVRVHSGVAHRVQVVRDLQTNRHRMRLALAIRIRHAHHPTVGAVRYPGDHAIIRRQHQAGVGFAKMHQGTRACARSESSAVDHDLPAGNCSCGRHPLDTRNAVLL